MEGENISVYTPYSKEIKIIILKIAMHGIIHCRPQTINNLNDIIYILANILPHSRFFS